ncbi:hypothetical protein PoB_006292300 [Plakobranchus ocellatus]|uniref:Uncharacterized protein n=1 Tax=Plakobranchus ocellatus TaxID=259542 RepID=A0AAV4CX12_9GAST|nr:hypothetical protein PoB_006292300 [Plakobranchus ocellatus]
MYGGGNIGSEICGDGVDSRCCRCSEVVMMVVVMGASVAQWLESPPCDLQGTFCRGFEPRNRRPGLAESPKV